MTVLRNYSRAVACDGARRCRVKTFDDAVRLMARAAAGVAAGSDAWQLAQGGTTILPCHRLSLGCHFFGICTVILLSLLSFSVKMTVSPRARRGGRRLVRLVFQDRGWITGCLCEGARLSSSAPILDPSFIDAIEFIDRSDLSFIMCRCLRQCFPTERC